MLQRVFVDADVLASRTQYDWLAVLRDVTADSFQLHSSPEAVIDAVRAWRRRDPAARAASSRRRLDLLIAGLDEVVGGAIDAVDLDGDLGTGIPVREEAVVTGAHVLLSSSVGPADEDALPFEICTPDEFFCLVDDSAPECVRAATVEQASRSTRASGGGDGDPLAAALIAASCPAFAERVSSHLRALAHSHAH